MTLSRECSSDMITLGGRSSCTFSLYQSIVILPYPFAEQVKWAPNGSAAVVFLGCVIICGGGTKRDIQNRAYIILTVLPDTVYEIYMTF